MTQNDLFELKNPPNKSAAKNSPSLSFLDRYRIALRLDHVLIAAILLLVSYVPVFAFGIERGKALRHTPRAVKEAPVTATPETGAGILPPEAVLIREESVPVKPVVIETPAVVAAEPTAGQKGADNPAVPTGKFTIQLITYLSQAKAEKHIQTLLAKGHKGFVVPSGKYLLVCVDGFDSRQAARTVLKSLQTVGMAPPDAYVRMMPRS